MEVFKVFTIHAAHSVAAFGPFHKCSRKHGHTYKVRIFVTCAPDPVTNIAMPFNRISDAWAKIGEPLDHCDLNERFGENATCEALAMFIHGQMGVELGHECRVEVWETETSGVSI